MRSQGGRPPWIRSAKGEGRETGDERREFPALIANGLLMAGEGTFRSA